MRHRVAVDFGDLSPCQALLVEQSSPTDTLSPALEHLDIQAILPEVMELEFNVVLCQVFLRPPAGVTTFDSVYRQHGLIFLLSISQQIVEAGLREGLFINVLHNDGTIQ